MTSSKTLLLLALSILTPALHAADKSQIADRLKTAAERSSLQSPSLTPWHITVGVTLFDVDGNNPTPANIEIWSAASHMKMIESVSGHQVTTIRNNDKLFRTTTTAPEFARLELLVEQIVDPIPDQLLQPGVKLNEEKTSIAKIPLDCINPSVPAPSSDTISIGSQLSFCFRRDTDSLLISYAPGEVANVRQQVGTFQSKEVPVDLKILSGRTLRAEAKLTKLETFTPQPDSFTPSDDMTVFTGPVEVEARDLINSVLSKMPPIYPVSAKARGAGGSVKFEAIIGADGRIVSLQPTANTNPDLTQAAQDAVVHWVYRPFLVCGLPVPIKTTITVNFNLGM